MGVTITGDKFVPGSTIKKQTLNKVEYSYDLGHLSPNGDWRSMIAKKNTFTAVNRVAQVKVIVNKMAMLPTLIIQHSLFNQEIWGCVEQTIRMQGIAGETQVVITWVNFDQTTIPKTASYTASNQMGSIRIPYSISKAIFQATTTQKATNSKPKETELSTLLCYWL